MNYLLDTHTLLWFFNGDKAFMSYTAKEIILNQQHIKYASMASVWEVGIKITTGKLVFPENTYGFVNQIQKNVFELLQIKPSHIIAIEQLPLIHRDPFDRLLIAIANSEEMGLISCDGNIKQYQVNRVW